MNDIDLAGVTWTSKSVATGAEFNGNGYSIKNLTGTQGLFSGNHGTIKNLNIANAQLNPTAESSGILAGQNYSSGTIENCSVSGSVTSSYRYVGGLVGSNYGTIKNVAATADVNSTSGYVGGLVGSNGGTIVNASASGDVEGASKVGGLVGSSSNTIENCSATGNVAATGNTSGGLVGQSSGNINNSYSLGNVTSDMHWAGGLVGSLNGATISNSYAKGDVVIKGSHAGGLLGSIRYEGSVLNCYATGNINAGGHAGGLVGTIYDGLIVENSYSMGTVTAGNTSGAFVGNNGSVSKLNATNVYANSEQTAGIVVEQAGVTAMPKDWFEDSENLTFLGDAYDYYYNPPEIKGNSESYASEFIKFQIGANEGKDNMLSLNLTFKMNFFSADVSSIEKASATLEKVDEFKQTLTEKRSEIGAARNRLESVIESQNVRLENLEASHSTMVDTDFAFEAANLTKMQILQNTTATLLAQANTLPSLALQLLE